MDPLTTFDGCNAFRFDATADGGHYESYFQRANHPNRPLAFWIRYTVFSPAGRAADTVGERWAVYFDGEAGRVVAAKDVVPVECCRFSSEGLDVRIGEAALDHGMLRGEASGAGGVIAWDLRYVGDASPLRLLPRKNYDGGFPRAKALVGLPLARFNGALTIAGERVEVRDWVGSQNHNWGSRHTDEYAWGQVAGFEGAPDAFLEVSTARVKVGRLWTPFITLAVLRIDGEQYDFNGLLAGARAHGRFEYFEWTFAVAHGGVRLSGRMRAPREAFVALRYDNPPGGYKTCLNTKIASCALALQRPGQPVRTLQTDSRAAFEILTSDGAHGLTHRA